MPARRRNWAYSAAALTVFPIASLFPDQWTALRIGGLVLGVGDGFDEVRVAPDAPHVIGRAGPFALHALRVRRLRVHGDEPLEQDLVPPAVATATSIVPAC